MSIKESALSAITSITQSDFIRVVTNAGASRKLSVQNAIEISRKYYRALPGGSSLTVGVANVRGTIALIGGDTSRRGMYILYGYSNGADLTSIKAASASDTITSSGTNLVITNSGAYVMGICFDVYTGVPTFS